jgi:membrane-associated phospholipid phosphatase
MGFFQKLLQWLVQWDTSLFLKINTEWTNPVFDSIFPWWREANTWVPFYLFLVVFALMNFGKKAWLWILVAAVTLVITDQLSSHLIKNWVARPRPCRNEELASQVRLLLNNCSGAYSFTSSHAANHFGFAVFLIISLRDVFGKWRYWLLLWAASIAYGQVYVGVHYPLDILGGALLGVLAGLFTGRFYNRKFGMPELDTNR